jgi:hypothetical protein
MHLWWVAVEVEILDADLHKLADPRTGQEQRLDHQPVTAARSVGGLDQALDFDAIEAIHTAPRPVGGARSSAHRTCSTTYLVGS